MEYEILAIEWRSALFTVGFVAYATGNPVNVGEWNSVVGYVPGIYTDGGLFLSAQGYGKSEDKDAQFIAANGAKIEWNIAKELFPHLDITKYKYYRGGEDNNG